MAQYNTTVVTSSRFLFNMTALKNLFRKNGGAMSEKCRE